MNVLVLGGTGLLGRYLVPLLRARDHEVTVRSRSTSPPMDLGDRTQARRSLDEVQPDRVIYAAANTDLEACEGQGEVAWRLHRSTPSACAEWCRDHDVPMVYISTDSVFDGEKGDYSESDEANPLNVYAVTKFLGEREVLAHGGLVVRTNFIGAGGRSFMSWLWEALTAGREVVGYRDIRFSPIYAGDLADSVERVISRYRSGLIHIGGRESITKHEIALEVSNAVDGGRVVAGDARQNVVRRPLDTTLRSDRAYGLWDLEPRGWRDAVAACVNDLREAS